MLMITRVRTLGEVTRLTLSGHNEFAPFRATIRPPSQWVRYVLPRHKAATWVGPGRGRKSTRPGEKGVVNLSPFK